MTKERAGKLVEKFQRKYPYAPLADDVIELPFGSDRFAVVGQKGVARPFLPEGMTLEIDTEKRYSEGALFVVSSSENVFSSVIKTSNPESEYKGSQKIKDYLKVVPAKLIQDKEGNPYYICHFVGAPNLEYALNHNQPEALIALQKLTADLQEIWTQTRKPYVKEQLARDYTKMTADSTEKPSTIDRIAKATIENLFGGDESVLDKVFYLNGEKIGAPKQLFEEMKRDVLTPPEFMVLTHGDEIGSNILVKTENNEVSYRLVDTLLSGYYDQSWILAFQLFTRMHVSNTHYAKDSQVQVTPDAVVIENFQPIQTEVSQKAKELILNFIDDNTKSTEDLRRVAAYAYTNIARSTAFLREKSWRNICEEYQLEHFIEGLRVYKEIMDLQQRTLVMRHGKDQLLATGHHNGWAPDNPLTEEGVKQAEEAAQQLRGKRIEVILSSPLDRAEQTARIVSNVVGAPVVIEERLIDRRRFPDWEGVHYTEFTKHDHYPEWKVKRNEYEFKLPGGESLGDVEIRVRPLFEELTTEEKYKGKRVLIVSHGDVIQTIQKIVTGALPSAGQIEVGTVLVRKGDRLGALAPKEI